MSTTILTSRQEQDAYTLGRFLAIAEMAADPIWRMTPEDVLQRVKEIAAEHISGSYSGNVIAGLQDLVERIQGPTVEEREPCQDCFDSGEILVRGAESNYVEVIKCDHGKSGR